MYVIVFWKLHIELAQQVRRGLGAVAEQEEEQLVQIGRHRRRLESPCPREQL